jgi:hydroxyethylthiazole kinase-like uncharacterized protein yjeF
MNQDLKQYTSQLTLPQKDSHKGQNGKMLLIGGSELFHAASKWSLDVASKIVDMVFYSSVSSNNELIKQAKSEFWNGIVIERENLDDYVQESDCVLIGPGMERNKETENLVNDLLKKYPNKKFVIDAGALQMLDPNLLQSQHIITPHQKEMVNLQLKCDELNLNLDDKKLTVLLKGKDDQISWFEGVASSGEPEDMALGNDAFIKQEVLVSGGNEGMTKGGTGDVLAGLVAALYCKNKPEISVITASLVNKKASDELYKQVGPFFNSSDLVEQVPKTLWAELN